MALAENKCAMFHPFNMRSEDYGLFSFALENPHYTPGKWKGNPLQYSPLSNPMDRGAWWTAVHAVTKSWNRTEQLSTATLIMVGIEVAEKIEIHLHTTSGSENVSGACGELLLVQYLKAWMKRESTKGQGSDRFSTIWEWGLVRRTALRKELHLVRSDQCFSLALFPISSIQSLSRVWLFATPWIAAHQASLSITNSWSLFTLMSIELVMPSISSSPLLLPLSIFPGIRVFPVSQFFPSGSQSIRVSASESVLPMNIQDWFL